jgi:hypothetical protein
VDSASHTHVQGSPQKLQQRNNNPLEK